MPQRTMLAVESIFYDNFIALIERPRTSPSPSTAPPDTKKATEQIGTVVKDTDKSVTSKFYTTSLQNVQMTRLKKIPHYARLLAFINLYQPTTTTTPPPPPPPLKTEKSKTNGKSPKSKTKKNASKTAKDTIAATPATPTDPPQSSEGQIKESTDDGAEQTTATVVQETEQADISTNATPSTKSSKPASKKSKKTVEDPDEQAFQERLQSIVVTEDDALVFAYQLDLARLVFSMLIKNELFKDIIYTSSAAQKAFLFLFVPIIFKPDQTGLISDFIEVLKGEEDLLEAAYLDGNIVSIEKALFDMASLGLTADMMKTSAMEQEAMEDGKHNSGDEEREIQDTNHTGHQLGHSLVDIRDEKINYNDELLEFELDTMCIVCQYRRTYKKNPRHFVDSYERSLETARSNAGASSETHLKYYRLLYLLSTSLKSYWIMLETHPVEEVRERVAKLFSAFDVDEGSTKAGSETEPTDKPPELIGGATNGTGASEAGDVLASFPGHFADHSTLSNAAEA